MIRVLHPDSITPIEPYLSRCRRARASLESCLDFALILLLRELEFVALHVKHVPGGPKLEWPTEPDVWAPHSLTGQGQFWLEADLAQAALPDWTAAEDRPRDLFGFKQEAADRLERALRSERPGITTLPVLFKLWRDLLRLEAIARQADRWAKRDGRIAAPAAYLFEAASLLSKRPGDAWAGAAARAERLARPLLNKRQAESALWSQRVIDPIEVKFLDRALAVRKRVEPGFARYLTTEAKFFASERVAAMKDFDDMKVPPRLRDLIPLAREFGIGDDPGRAFFIGKTSKTKRSAAAASIQAAGPAIDEWLAKFDHSKELPTEARAFFWLREAGEEM